MDDSCQNPREGTHYMKVTTYALPFRPPFFRFLENLYSFDPYTLTKMRKMLYFEPYFLSKLGKMYIVSTPLFFYPCSVLSRRAVLSIPIRNLTEYPRRVKIRNPSSVPATCFLCIHQFIFWNVSTAKKALMQRKYKQYFLNTHLWIKFWTPK